MHAARSSLLLLLFLALAPAAARAQTPSLRLSWDQCDPIVVNHPWTGPGTYVIQASAAGLAGTYRSANFAIYFYPYSVAPAWDFSTFNYWSGGTVCQGGSRLQMTSAGVDCPAYPTQFLYGYMWEGSLTQPGRTVMFADLTLDPTFDADPAQRYSLVRFAFDHSHSVEGPGGPGTCGGVEQPMCISIAGVSLRDGQNVERSWAIEQGYLTWQDAANSLGCPGAVPARAATWGAIKATYH